MSKHHHNHHDMSEKEQTDNQNIDNTNAAEAPQTEAEAPQPQQPEAETREQEQSAAPDPGQQLQELAAQLEKEKKEYLFLMADFDNFRKRTIREKAELIRNGAERAMADLLPVVDDFERAIKAGAESDDIDAVRQGIELIYNKFVKYLEQNQVKPILSDGQPFDTGLHEAVTTFPVDDDKLRGHVIDTMLRGYTINGKVLRHAKVVVGK